MKTFGVERSLSMKGCSYDNTVAEATFKIIKTEFIHQMKFDSLEQLRLEFSDYVNWFNKLHIHGTPGKVSPLEYKKRPLKKAV
ncbi:IS3 family transposase [Domibacillus sp. PGB-M46]|uniref:IS3 family transposase n=1 Tax=Domibacillus sp. PGB-M46 TaxID=2910255 RepID=UPI0035C8B916